MKKQKEKEQIIMNSVVAVSDQLDFSTSESETDESKKKQKGKERVYEIEIQSECESGNDADDGGLSEASELSEINIQEDEYFKDDDDDDDDVVDEEDKVPRIIPILKGIKPSSSSSSSPKITYNTAKGYLPSWNGFGQNAFVDSPSIFVIKLNDGPDIGLKFPVILQFTRNIFNNKTASWDIELGAFEVHYKNNLLFQMINFLNEHHKKEIRKRFDEFYKAYMSEVDTFFREQRERNKKQMLESVSPVSNTQKSQNKVNNGNKTLKSRNSSWKFVGDNSEKPKIISGTKFSLKPDSIDELSSSAYSNTEESASEDEFSKLMNDSDFDISSDDNLSQKSSESLKNKRRKN